ncbi:MAG: ABC transporter ATP-binding protein, partial [Spirochaetota bacterium]
DPAAYVGLQRHGRFGIMPVKMLDSLPHHMLVKLRRDDLRAVAVLGSVIILCIVLSFGLTYAGVILVTSGGQNVIHDMRMALYSHVSMLPMRYFDTHKSGKIVTRLTNDINNIEEFFTAVFINIFKDIFILTGIISVLIVLNPRLGGVTLLLMPVIIAVSLGFRVRMRRAFRRVREALASVNARLSETITGATVIQQFNRQDRYNEKFVSDNNAYFKASENQVFVNSLFNPIISFIRFAGLGIIVYIGSRFVIGGALSLGTLIVFISYLEKFFQPIQDIAEKINIMQSAMASSERIFDLLDEPEEPDADPALTFEKLMSRESEYLIEFDNVTFAYNDDEPVLKNFTLKICHGESVALVGHTGCGKTTVISLLSRLYPVENGTIRIQGVDIRTVPLAVLRRAIGVVQQDVTLFSDTVRRNILLGRSESSAELDTVCEYTNCSGFIEKLPDGFDTVLSEEGMSLSFGERQLISFARVISYDPDIFVLDEATSNIDTETEILIQDTLNRILENKTSIVIAHRLSTIKHCDRIVVMHHGEIIEQGTHTELLNRRETYYRLYLLQYRTQTGSGIKGFTK